MTLEGCVVRISDIIGYIGKDIDDANRLGIFNKELLPENVKKYLGTENTQIMNSIIIDVIKIVITSHIYQCQKKCMML